MRNLTTVIVIILILVGGYYSGKAAGFFGGPSAMSTEEVSAYLEKMANNINNADGGLRYDDASKLVSATHEGKKITIRGETQMDMAQLDDGYLDTRYAQASNKLCFDDAAKAALAGGAHFIYNWFSADNQSIGTVDIKGADYCA